MIQVENHKYLIRKMKSFTERPNEARWSNNCKITDLQTATEDFRNTCNLAKTKNLSSWDVGNVQLAKEGNQVVLTHGKHVDISYYDHIVGVDSKYSSIEYICTILPKGLVSENAAEASETS
jgi:hypothetical protein